MPKVTAEYLQLRRDAIIETARAVFAERGFAATSMADLVRATGLSMGGLYRYFPSKAHLVAAVAEGRDGTVEGSFDQNETAEQLLRRLLQHVSAGPEGMAHARLVVQIWGGAAIEPALAAMARERHRALRDHLAGRLPEPVGPCSPSAPAPAAVADVALAALIGYAALAASDYQLDDQGFAQALAKLITQPRRAAPAPQQPAC